MRGKSRASPKEKKQYRKSSNSKLKGKSRASPTKKSNNQKHLRPSLSKALKKGVITLHRSQVKEIMDKRGSPFRVDIGMGFVTANPKSSRLYFQMSYAKDESKALVVQERINGAERTQDYWQLGRINGAFWVILKPPKKLLTLWLTRAKVTLVVVLTFSLVGLVATHPELGTMVSDIVRYLLKL